MRIYQLTDAELAGFPPERLTNITVATGGEDGAPELPEALGGAELALSATPTPSAAASTARLPIIPSRAFRAEFWVYYDLEAVEGDYWGAVTSNLQLVCRTRSTDVSRFLFVAAKKDATHIYWRLDYYDNNGENISYNTASPVSGWSYNLAAPHWLKVVMKWQAESAPGAGDGVIGLKIYDVDGVTLRAQLADKTNALTGHDPVQTIGFYVMPRSNRHTVYVADFRVWDESTGDTPGVLCPFVHSYDAAQKTVRVRAVCDRPVSAALTYGDTGVENQAVPARLDYNDGGRWAEFIVNVDPDRPCRYQFKLTDSVDSAKTATISQIADDDCMFTIPGCEPVKAFLVSDHHSTVHEPYYQRRAMMDRTGAGKPNVIVMLGDMICSRALTGLNVPAARLELAAFHGAWRGMLATALSIMMQGNHEAYPVSDWTGDAKAHLHKWHPIVGNSPVRFASQRIGNVEFVQVDDTIFTASAFANIIARDIIPAFNSAKDANHIVFCSHHFGMNFDEINSLHKPCRGMSWDETNWESVHNALRECVRCGQTASWWQGHLHGGSWWRKDGVSYMVLPNHLRAVPKNTSYGNFQTSPGGDPGSVLKSFWGAGGQAGTNGYAWVVLSNGALRAAIMDVVTSSSTPAVLTHTKVLDRVVCVPKRPASAVPRTGAVTVSFLDDLQPGDAIRIVTRNQWNGIRDLRRYQWADILVGGETPAWGHVGLDVVGDWSAATAAQLLYTQADRTSTTWEYGGISNKLTITPNPGWEWGEVAVYNTLTWTPITDRIRVEFL